MSFYQQLRLIDFLRHYTSLRHYISILLNSTSSILLLIILLSATGLNAIATKTEIDSILNYAAKISSSDHKKSLSILKSAHKRAESINYKRGIAEAIRLKGLAYLYDINYNQALKLFLESKNKFQEINDLSGVAKANNLIAVVYSFHGLHQKSLDINFEILRIRQSIKDSAGISTSYNNIGVDYKDLKKIDSALIYYKKALTIELTFNDSASISRYMNNIGTIYLELNQFDSAYSYISTALAIREKINERQGLMNSYESMGLYFYKLGKPLIAKDWQEKSLAIAKEIGIIYEMESITNHISATYAKLGEYSKAYDMLRLNRQLLDSLRANETQQLLAKIELNRAFEQQKKIQNLEMEQRDLRNRTILSKERSIKLAAIIATLALFVILVVIWYILRDKKSLNDALLEKQEEILAQNEEIKNQNESIAIQNDQLTRLNAEKDKFFSIISHDLKSPFSGFLGLTKMLAESSHLLETEDIKELSHNLQDSAGNLYALLENLLEWSRIQRGATQFNPEPVQLQLIITQNINIQSEVARLKEIEILSTMQTELFAYADIPMLNTVLRNLLSNAIKFTKRGGKIEVGADEYSDNSTLTAGKFIRIFVKDSGIGMSHTNQEKLFRIDQKISTPGTENEPSTGLGLLLCKEFIQKQGGRIWVDSQVGKGSTFQFTLPLPTAQS